MLNRFNFLFPIWAILLSVVAYLNPEIFIPLKPSIIYLLAIVMFGMGITLKPKDFLQLAKLKTILLVGLALQFLIMPLAAWLISLGFSLTTPLLTGMVLVGACPGGTASNVICYLARGNVALSIALTTASTLLAVLATPLFTWLYLGQSVDVPLLRMMYTVLQVIVLPVSIGVLINYFFGERIAPITRFFPSVSVIFICIIIAIIAASNHTKLHSIAAIVVVAVMLHNFVGLLIGYLVSYLLGYDKTIRKTIAIEVGMQNSGLAVALAIEYFKPLAALPGAVFSIWHNLSGALLAVIWSKQTKNKTTNGFES